MNQTAPTPYGFRKAVSLVMDDLALAKRHSREKEEEKVQQPLQSQETIYDKKIMERRKKLKEEKNIRMSKLQETRKSQSRLSFDAILKQNNDANRTTLFKSQQVKSMEFQLPKSKKSSIVHPKLQNNLPSTI